MHDILQLAVTPQQWLGRCVAVEITGGRRTIHVRESSGDAEIHHADCVDHVAPAPGDLVLLIQPEATARAVVIGTIGAAARPQTLPTGYSVACDEGRVQLRDPDGRLALEIDTAGAAPSVRPGAGDLVLDLEGRLTVAARSIDLRAKLGEFRVKANDDVVMEGERIRLN